MNLEGVTPESWYCIDCGLNTAPGWPSRVEVERAFNGKALKLKPTELSLSYDEHTEIYHVRDRVWKAAGMQPYGGCLCIGCLEKRIGRQLRPKDFARHPFNTMPGTERLLQRRDGTM